MTRDSNGNQNKKTKGAGKGNYMGNYKIIIIYFFSYWLKKQLYKTVCIAGL